MSLKRILFIVLCVLFALTIIFATIVVSRVAGMINGETPPVSVTEDPTKDSTGDSQSPDESNPPATDETPTDTKHEHTMYKFSVNYPNCTQYGWTVFKCDCGKTSTGEFKDPLGHSYGTGQTVAPTCTEKGATYYTCSRCSHVEERSVIQPLGHSFTIVMEEIDATCTENAYIIRRCSRSGCTETKKEELLDTVLNHDWVEITGNRIEPTCTEAGTAFYACGNDDCTETREESIPALGHDLGDWSSSDGQASCQRGDCDFTVAENQMEITKESSSEGDGCTHYIIEVGTADAKCLYVYDVINYLADKPDFEYVQGVGLKITYPGGEETLALHTDGQFTIEDTQQETEPPTEGSTEEPTNSEE